MAYDLHKNFAYSTVLTAPSPASSGTSLVVQSGDGTKFPTPPFNATVWPTATAPSVANAEIVRVTGISTDTLTITRAQESSSARTVIVGDQIAATMTAKTFTDIENLGFNAYKFGAYSTAAQNSGNAAFAQTLFATEEYDTGNNFASSTFTAPVAAFYHFDAGVATNAGATIWIVSLFKNGSEFKRGNDIRYASALNAQSLVSVDVQLAASDTVDIRTFGDSARAINVSQATCYFTGHLVSLT